jgi:hypothetical protein
MKMYFIRNTVKNAVLTYRDGSRMSYGSQELAKNHADSATQTTGEFHDTVHVASGPFMPLNRIKAPWFA